MQYPPLLELSSEIEYRRHYEKKYCRAPIITFDNHPVFFKKDRFDHIFFESSHHDGIKDKFSTMRAKRIDWIEVALQDPNADLYVGWDKKRKRNDHSHRVVLVKGNYIVIIRFDKHYRNAFFVTAFLADSQRTLFMIKQGKKWKRKSR